MSSSDDDAPLAGRGKANGANGHAKPAISIVNGHPDQEENMDVDGGTKLKDDANGKRRRTSAGKSYKEASASDDDDDVPLSKRRKTAKPLRLSAGHVEEDSCQNRSSYEDQGQSQSRDTSQENCQGEGRQGRNRGGC